MIVDAMLVVKKYVVKSVNNIEKGMCQKDVQNEKPDSCRTFTQHPSLPQHMFLCFAYIRYQIFIFPFIYIYLIMHRNGGATSTMVFICLNHLIINNPLVGLDRPTTQYDIWLLTNNQTRNKTPKQ